MNLHQAAQPLWSAARANLTDEALDDIAGLHDTGLLRATLLAETCEAIACNIDSRVSRAYCTCHVPDIPGALQQGA